MKILKRKKEEWLFNSDQIMKRKEVINVLGNCVNGRSGQTKIRQISAFKKANLNKKGRYKKI